MASETRELRSRQGHYLDAADRLAGPPPAGNGALVVITVAVKSYPAAAGVYYGVQQVDVGGPEVEGGAAVFTTTGSTFYVLVLPGSAVPTVGTRLVVDPVEGRWVCRS